MDNKNYKDEHLGRYCLICGKKWNMEKSTWGLAHGNWYSDIDGDYFAMGDTPTFYICESCLNPYLESRNYLKLLANQMITTADYLRNKHAYNITYPYYIYQFKQYREEYLNLRSLDTIAYYLRKNHELDIKMLETMLKTG